MDGDVPGSETDSSAVSLSSRVMFVLQLDSDVFSLSLSDLETRAQCSGTPPPPQIKIITLKLVLILRSCLFTSPGGRYRSWW